MNARENLEAGIAQARADRDKAGAERTKIGADWRKHADPSVGYDKFRANWAKADAEWEQANAVVEKLGAALADLEHAEERVRIRASVEAAVDKARTELDKADAALAVVAKARAEREKNTSVASARVEHRTGDAERRKGKSNRRSTEAKPGGLDTTAKNWAEAVNSYNKADAEWNRARAALAELNRTDSKP